MSTVSKTPQPQPLNILPKPTTGSRVSGDNKTKADDHFLFDKENYMYMIGGIALILLGFVLMAGGKSPDPHKFNYDEVYSFRRITVAPLVLLAGIVVEIYAILKKPAEVTESTAQI